MGKKTKARAEDSWDAKRVARFRRAWDDGVSVKDIGPRFGVQANVVYRIAERLGCSPRCDAQTTLANGTP